MADLIARAPVWPDFELCHPFYQYQDDPHYTEILWEDCLQAYAKIPRGDTPVEWSRPIGSDLDEVDHKLEQVYNHGERSQE